MIAVPLRLMSGPVFPIWPSTDSVHAARGIRSARSVVGSSVVRSGAVDQHLFNGVEFPTTIFNFINALRRRSASRSAADARTKAGRSR